MFVKQGKLRGESRSGRAPRLGSQAAPQEEAAVTASQAAQVMSAVFYAERDFCCVYCAFSFCIFSYITTFNSIQRLWKAHTLSLTYFQ